MDYNVIIRPLVGAVIGYSTNWLAIKMLFKPHEEKRIAGIKVPFTPGVIPRERNRIAKSLGEAVGERLLTEEVIAGELLNTQVTDHIKYYVIHELLNQDISLEQVLEVVFKEDTATITKGFGRNIAGEIGMYMNLPGTREVIRSTIREYMTSVVPYDANIGHVLTESMTSEVSGLVRNNIDDVSSYLGSIANQEAVKARIAQAIETLVMEKVGALGAMFLDGPSMAESVVAYLEEVLKEEAVEEAIITTIDQGVEALRSRNISETVSIGLYQEMIHGLTEKILEGLYERMNEEALVAAISPMVTQLIKKKIHLSDEDKKLIEGQIEVLYRNFIEKNISTFLETFDVSKIVESEINQFSVMDIEQLIFAIVDKELNAITWIGGVLGFIIGLVYVVI